MPHGPLVGCLESVMSESPFGPHLEKGQVRFSLWAPDTPEVLLETTDGALHRMEKAGDDWIQCVLPARAGQKYRYQLGEHSFPDPASRLQAGGIHGWSVVTAP